MGKEPLPTPITPALVESLHQFSLPFEEEPPKEDDTEE